MTSNERLLQVIETGLAAMRDCQRNAHGGKVCFDGDEWHERWALLSEARRMLRSAVETTEQPVGKLIIDYAMELQTARKALAETIEYARQSMPSDRYRHARLMCRGVVHTSPEEPAEQLFRLRPLCICDNALTNQNPACPIHGSSENGPGKQT